MNINFLFLSLILSLISAEVAASDTMPSDTMPLDHAGVIEKGTSEVTVKGGTVTVDIVGHEIHNIYGKVIGDVDQVVRTLTGKQAVIGLYNSLKEIALPLNDLHWKGDELFVELLEGDIDRMDDVDLGDAEELAPGEYFRHEFSQYEPRTKS